MKFIKLPLFLLLCLHLFTSVQGQTAAQFQDGDRVCFIGDSITHGGSYHNYIYLYYLTRFPDRNIEIFNAGISGDQLSGVNDRFLWDIAGNNPTVCTVMMGMNDIQLWLYPDGSEANKQYWIDAYEINMTILKQNVEGIGSAMTLITPSIYDQTAAIPEFNRYMNDGLVGCADKVSLISAISGHGLVRFNAPMLSYNAQIQAIDPADTLVGGDRIHPGDDGNFMMASLFLKDQGCPDTVAVATVNAFTGNVSRSDNCSVLVTSHSVSGLEFQYSANALPMPNIPGTERSRGLVSFDDDFNQEIFQVQNLQPGSYELRIDSVTVGTYSEVELSNGINLAVMEKTPQYRQAVTVMTLNQERHNLVASELRAIAYIRALVLEPAGVTDIYDEPAVTNTIDAWLAGSAGEPWHDYDVSQANNFYAARNKLPDTEARLSELQTLLYQKNQPYTRTVKIYDAASPPPLTDYRAPSPVRTENTIALWHMDSCEIGSEAGQLSDGGSALLNPVSNQLQGNAVQGNTTGGEWDIYTVVGSAGSPDYFPSGADPSLTVEAWVKFDADAIGDGCIVDKNTMDFNSGYFLHRDANNKLAFYAGGNGYAWYGVTSVGTVPNGVWTHVAGSWDANSNIMKVWINGVEDNALYVAGMTIADSGQALNLMNRDGWRMPMDGMIDEVRISDVALNFEHNFQTGEVAPIWLSDPVVKADAAVGAFYSASITSSDFMNLDGDPITHYSLRCGPDWLSIDSVTGVISGTPVLSDVGVNSLLIAVSDDDGTTLGNVNITVSEDLYSIWKSSTFTDPDAPNTGRADDFDNDGHSNEFEYLFAMNPEDAGNSRMPHTSVVDNAGSDHLAIVYVREIGSTMNYEFRTSTDLGNWSAWASEGTEMIQHGSAVDNEDGTETVTVLYQTPISADSKRFVQVRATED